MSTINHPGSVANVDFPNYDYDSHHVTPFENGNNDNNNAYNSLRIFYHEPQPEKEVLLGVGTGSKLQSEQRHKIDMERQLAVINIDRKLRNQQEE